MPFTVHSTSYTDALPPLTPEQTAARRIGSDDTADPAPRRVSVLVWIIPVAVFWAAVVWVVWRVI